MSAITRNSAIEPVRSGGITHVDGDTLRQLLGWVENIATPEDIAWNSDRFKEVRDWLKQHKAAKDMRRKAIRIECIALRKVAVSGLAEKLNSIQERSAAKYFAGMSDEEFNDLLDESEIVTTPYGVMNARSKEESSVHRWFKVRADSHADTATESGEFVNEVGYDRGLAGSVQKILSQISLESDSFTVKEAADRLFDDLRDIGRNCNNNGDDSDEHFPPELAGEPLREVVRRVLRTPGAADQTDIAGVSVVIPRYVTFNPASGDLAARIPWDRATIGQLMNMVVSRERQAHEMQVAAGNLRRLYECLNEQSEDDSSRVVDLTQAAGLREGRRAAA